MFPIAHGQAHRAFLGIMIVALAAEKSAVTQAATILQYGNKIVVDGDDSRIDVSRALITSKELNDEILLIDEIRFVGWTPERYSPEKRFHLTFQSIEPLESGRHYWQDLSFARVGVFGEIGPLEDSEFPVTSNLNFPVGAGFEVLEIDYGPRGELLRLAVDFNLISGPCRNSVTSGQLRYNSSIPVPEPNGIILSLVGCCGMLWNDV
jgi:hypothetical protein